MTDKELDKEIDQIEAEMATCRDAGDFDRVHAKIVHLQHNGGLDELQHQDVEKCLKRLRKAQRLFARATNAPHNPGPQVPAGNYQHAPAGNYQHAPAGNYQQNQQGSYQQNQPHSLPQTISDRGPNQTPGFRDHSGYPQDGHTGRPLHERQDQPDNFQNRGVSQTSAHFGTQCIVINIVDKPTFKQLSDARHAAERVFQSAHEEQQNGISYGPNFEALQRKFCRFPDTNGDIIYAGATERDIFFNQATWTFWRIRTRKSGEQVAKEIFPFVRTVGEVNQTKDKKKDDVTARTFDWNPASSYDYGAHQFAFDYSLHKTDNGFIWINTNLINTCGEACRWSLNQTHQKMVQEFKWIMNGADARTLFTDDFLSILLKRQEQSKQKSVGDVAFEIFDTIKSTLNTGFLQGWNNAIWTRDAFTKIAVAFPNLSAREVALMLGENNVMFNFVYPHFHHFLKGRNSRKQFTKRQDAKACMMEGRCQ